MSTAYLMHLSDETLLELARFDDRSMSAKAVRARAARFECERRAAA